MLFGLPAGILTLVQSNIIQTRIAKEFSSYLSKELGTKISIDRVQISFFVNVKLKGVYVEDLHKNVLLKASCINVKPGDFDISGNYFELKKVALENTFFNLHNYKGEEKTNLQFIINYFKSTKKKPQERKYPVKIMVRDFELSGSGFSYADDNKAHNNPDVVDFHDISLTRLNIKMENVAIIGDSVAGTIKSLELKEKSGFVVGGFSAKTVVSKRNIRINDLLVKTPNSNLDLDLGFTYDDFSCFKDFVNKVTINSDIRSTGLNLIDMAYFVREMHGMNNLICFSSGVIGKVSNLKIKNFMMKYGSDTYFDGDISMNGLPHIKNTYINMKIRRLITSVGDLNNIVIPAANRSVTHLKLPQMLLRMGNINIKGIFTGFYSNFVSYATLNSDVGSISTDIIVKNENKVITYDGKVTTENFSLGQLVNSDSLLGKVSLDARISGSGLTMSTADFTLKGNVQQLDFKKYSYRDIAINGTFNKKIFNGLININDKNVNLNFDGEINLNDSLPDFDFKADIAYANLKNLNILPKDSISEVKGKLNIDFYGTNIDNLRGRISVSDAVFKQNDRYFDLKSLKLNTDIDKTGYRTFDLKSDYVDAEFDGYFVFSELGNSFKRFILSFIPNFYFALDTNNKTVARQEFTFDIKLYNATPLVRYFLPDVNLAPNTTIKGNFNTSTIALVIDAKSSELKYKNYSFHNWKLENDAAAGIMKLLMEADTLRVSDSSYLSNFGFRSEVVNDTINSKLYWDNKKQKDRNAASVNFYTYFFSNSQAEIGFNNSEVVIDDSLWTISTKGKAVFDSTKIDFQDLMVYHKDQSLCIDGAISKSPLDVLSVKFNSFDISNFDYLTNPQKFDFDGILTGSVYISDLYTSPTYYADLKVKNIGFNNDHWGDAVIFTKWDEIKKGIQINAEINYVGSEGTSRPVVITGYYFPGKKRENFDININVTNLRLKSISRYFASFGSLQDGTASGTVYLRGTNKNPDLNGYLKVMRAALKINYLNTVYAFAYDSLLMTSSEFSFKNVVALGQPRGDTAIVSGTLHHTNFKNFSFDINIESRKVLCLNTNSSMNDIFYGKGYATGRSHIYGNPNDLRFDIAAKTDKGTDLIVPVGTTSALATSDYISFVNKAQEPAAEVDKGKQIKGFNIDMTFDVTDDAQVQLVFDPRVGDRILGIGNGNVRITVADGEMNMFGDYILTSGDYLFTFQNIINKRFIIEEGSTVKWNGDPYNAEMDIRAKYKIRANLAGLGIDTTTRYVPVECIINMKNSLANPEITFEVDLPTLLEYEKAPYLATINQNLDNNFISLLIINSFVNPNTGIGSVATAAGASLLGKSASEVLSNQLSNWLSQISKNVNIGVNYRPGDNISEEEVAVALSTQFLNDRVSVSSNLGVATGQNAGNPKNSNQIVGDVDFEVKLTKALKLKVYNHTNQNNILQYTSPFTQGLGILYRKDFNTFRDLFMKKKKLLQNP